MPQPIIKWRYVCGDIDWAGVHLRPITALSERAASHASANKVLPSSPCLLALNRHRSAQRQQTPSAILRAEESTVSRLRIPQITFMAELVSLLSPIAETWHQLTELKQTKSSHIWCDLHHRPQRVMTEPHPPLEKTICGATLPSYQCRLISNKLSKKKRFHFSIARLFSEPAWASQKPWEKKHHSPTTSINRALFSSTVVSEDRLAASSTGRYERHTGTPRQMLPSK